ncbi:MAG: hypothetical protein ABIJ94_04425 [candidate division WOR-3 bacterium]
MENDYLDMTGFQNDGWQVLVLRDDSSSYDGNWWRSGCGFSSIPGDPAAPLDVMKVANLAEANGHILKYEFKTIHNDPYGHFGFGFGFGSPGPAARRIGF